MVPSVSQPQSGGETRGLQGLAAFLGDILPQRSKAEIARGGRLTPSDLYVRQRCIPLYTAHTHHTHKRLLNWGGVSFFAFREVIEKFLDCRGVAMV